MSAKYEELKSLIAEPPEAYKIKELHDFYEIELGRLRKFYEYVLNQMPETDKYTNLIATIDDSKSLLEATLTDFKIAIDRLIEDKDQSALLALAIKWKIIFNQVVNFEKALINVLQAVSSNHEEDKPEKSLSEEFSKIKENLVDFQEGKETSDI